jgi:hypothetical protein
MRNIDYYQIKRWFWLIIIITFWCAMCAGCSSTYHLKQATKKDPSLSFIDTVRTVTTLPGVRARFSLDSLLLPNRVSVVDNIQVETIYKDSVKYVSVECPPIEEITKYVPKIKFIQESLTDRELVKRAKELGELKRIRIAGSIIWGAVLFGIFLGVIFAVIIRLKFFR